MSPFISVWSHLSSSHFHLPESRTGCAKLGFLSALIGGMGGDFFGLWIPVCCKQEGADGLCLPVVWACLVVEPACSAFLSRDPFSKQCRIQYGSVGLSQSWVYMSLSGKWVFLFLSSLWSLLRSQGYLINSISSRCWLSLPWQFCMINVGSNTPSLGMGTQLGPHHFSSSLYKRWWRDDGRYQNLYWK